MVYRIASDTRAGHFYRVDLLANNGAGQCSCKDFVTRRQPALNAGQPPWTTASACKHLRRTAWFFAKKLFREMAQAETER